MKQWHFTSRPSPQGAVGLGLSAGSLGNDFEKVTLEGDVELPPTP